MCSYNTDKLTNSVLNPSSIVNFSGVERELSLSVTLVVDPVALATTNQFAAFHYM